MPSSGCEYYMRYLCEALRKVSGKQQIASWISGINLYFSWSRLMQIKSHSSGQLVILLNLHAFQKRILLEEMWKVHCTKLTLPLLLKTQGVPHIPKCKAAQGSKDNKEICCLVKNHGIEKKSDSLSLHNFLLSIHTQAGYAKNYTNRTHHLRCADWCSTECKSNEKYLNFLEAN